MATSSAPDRILIVGAGGFGREVLHWMHDAWPDRVARLTGFLAADPHSQAGPACRLPIIGDPATFEPRPGDAFLLAIGIPGVRRRVAEDLRSRGARFVSLTHPTATVAATAWVGEGAIICPHAVVSVGSKVGAFALLNYHSSAAHDAVVGDFAVLSPYATLGGGARIGNDAFLALHASVGPGVTIGERSKVAANSCALVDVPADSLVLGVPGRVSPLLV